MNAKEAQEQHLISRSKKTRIECTAVLSCMLILFATMAVVAIFGISAASSALVAARHAQFHAVVGVVNDKGPLLGGPNQEGELLDHYRLRVRFRDSTGAVRNPKEAISWQLENRPTVKVYDGPGTTFDIPSAIEGPHPRNLDLWWLWGGGCVVAFVLGVILGWNCGIQIERLLVRLYLPKNEQNGPVPAT